jgi:hypothetical protein
MQQIILDLDNAESDRPGPVMEPKRQQQLIALMAEAIATILQNAPGDDHEPA